MCGHVYTGVEAHTYMSVYLYMYIHVESKVYLMKLTMQGNPGYTCL